MHLWERKKRFERLISAYFEIMEEMPYGTYFAFIACLAKLRDSFYDCAEYEYVKPWLNLIKSNVPDYLTEEIKKGGFIAVIVPETGKNADYPDKRSDTSAGSGKWMT